jgi:histone-lysine N-methyltransferase SETMAR
MVLSQANWKETKNKSWVTDGEKPRTVRQGRFEPKTMFSIFFKTSGAAHISYIKSNKTINHTSYINNCLKPLVRNLNEQRPQYGTKNLKFHHDNARPHIHSNVIAYLVRENFTIMDHPPYSPDLAPSDFRLFNYIKERLSNHTSVESLNYEITRIVQAIPIQEFRKTFEKWRENGMLYKK